MAKGAGCYRHPEQQATDHCLDCRQPICAACSMIAVGGSLCPRCVGRRHLRRRTGAAVGVVLGLGAIAGVIWQVKSYRPPFDYGEHSTDVRRLEEVFAREACDRTNIVKLTELMARAGDLRGALDRASQFFSACGDYARLRWVTFACHKQLSEFDAAIADATMLIEDAPDDQDFWWWRGRARVLKGDLESAERDLTQALLLLPQASSIPFDLAEVRERLGRFCEARDPILQYLHFRPDQWNDRRNELRIERLTELGECDRLSSGERAEIRFPAGARSIPVRARFNDQHVGTFLLDTGASMVTVTQKFASAIGLTPQPGKSLTMHSATGVHRAKLASARSIEVQGMRAEQVPVAVLDDMLEDLDGLLGLSFLSRFELQVDTARGVAVLQARGRGTGKVVDGNGGVVPGVAAAPDGPEDPGRYPRSPARRSRPPEGKHEMDPILEQAVDSQLLE